MQVLTNTDGYITSFAIDGILVDGTEVEAPKDLEHFLQHYHCYQIRKGALRLDRKRLQAEKEAVQKEVIRERRRKECFPIINRGSPWYERLSEEQRAELNTWYQAWLDATETGAIPKTPEWLLPLGGESQ